MCGWGGTGGTSYLRLKGGVAGHAEVGEGGSRAVPCCAAAAACSLPPPDLTVR